MRNCRWMLTGIMLGAASLGLLVGEQDLQAAGKTEAVRGKQYKLTERHGPWMIMVASFQEPPPDRRKAGMSPQEAADELVYELRKQGIPAYTFSQDDVTDQVNTFDRTGRTQQRVYYAQQGSVCVLAGNYGSAEDSLAQRTLAWIKKSFRPAYLGPENVESTHKLNDGSMHQKLKNGGIFRMTPGQPGPLSGAFLTINPVLSPEEAARRQRDPLIVQLNSGMEYSLLDNPGRFTLVVASSYVKSSTYTDEKSFRQKLETFTVTSNLDESAINAWQLTKTLRDGRVPIQNENFGVGQRNFEAYVFHDRYRSIVTVGSFDSPNDPRIAEFKKLFGAKMRPNPQTGQNVLIAEVMTLPDVSGHGAAIKSWIFDPEPQLIEVPRFGR